MNFSSILLIIGFFIAQAGFSLEFHVMFIPHNKIHELPNRDEALDLTHAIKIECDDSTTFAQLNRLLFAREDAPEWVKEPIEILNYFAHFSYRGDQLNTPQKGVKDLFEANEKEYQENPKFLNVERPKVLIVKPRDASQTLIKSLSGILNGIIVKPNATIEDLAQAIKDIYYPDSDAPTLKIIGKGVILSDNPRMEIREFFAKYPDTESLFWIPVRDIS
jgi:hypothetical protein